RRIDDAIALRAPSERLDAGGRAVDNAAVGLADPAPLGALDHLGDQDVAPGTQPGPSALTRGHGITKGLPNGSDIGHQAISTDQQGTTCRTAPYPRDQPRDRGRVALFADLAAQPQARLDHYGQGHPHDAALFLDAQ